MGVVVLKSNLRHLAALEICQQYESIKIKDSELTAPKMMGFEITCPIEFMALETLKFTHGCTSLCGKGNGYTE